MNFLKSLGVWVLLTDGSAFALFLRDGWLSGAQVIGLVEIFLVTLVSATLLRILVTFLNSAKVATLCGLILGFALPTFGGWLLSSVVSGFESPAIFAGAVMVSIPNAIGGAIAGWLQWRSVLANRKQETSRSGD